LLLGKRGEVAIGKWGRKGKERKLRAVHFCRKDGHDNVKKGRRLSRGTEVFLARAWRHGATEEKEIVLLQRKKGAYVVQGEDGRHGGKEGSFDGKKKEERGRRQRQGGRMGVVLHRLRRREKDLDSSLQRGGAKKREPPLHKNRLTVLYLKKEREGKSTCWGGREPSITPSGKENMTNLQGRPDGPFGERGKRKRRMSNAAQGEKKGINFISTEKKKRHAKGRASRRRRESKIHV